MPVDSFGNYVPKEPLVSRAKRFVRNRPEDVFLGVSFLAVAGLIVVMLAIVLFAPEDTYKKKLMTACMADGKKEYECYALLRDPTPKTVTVPMPVYVPMPSR